jgi:hypothetical protein
MKMRGWGCVLVILAPLWNAAAGETVIGKYAGEFISIGVGGRALALGSANVALANDVTAGYWNPAGLSRIMYPQFILMHDEQFGNLVNNDYGAVAIPFGATTTLGLSVIRVGVDDIANTSNAGVDANGNVTYDPNKFTRIDPNRVTYFNAADWAVYLTYSKKSSDDFSYGANVKFIRRDLGDHGATGVGFDLGLLYSPMENLTLGMNAQDITTTLVAWDTGRNELITPTLRLGGAYFISALSGRFAPVVDADLRFENRRSASTTHLGAASLDLHGGLEYQFKNLVALRVGYSDVKQLTMGAGLHFPKLSIDYSFAKFDGVNQLDNTHRISIMFTLESEQYKRDAE